MMSKPHTLSKYPVHLGLGATCTVQPEFTGTSPTDWFEDYGQRTEGDGAEGRLVTSFTFDSSWNTWEMHPHGAEVVLCIAGTVTLIQEGTATTTDDGASSCGSSRGTTAVPTTTKVHLNPGEYIINPPGVWHTADIEEGKEATVVFITAGKDTQIKARS